MRLQIAELVGYNSIKEEAMQGLMTTWEEAAWEKGRAKGLKDGLEEGNRLGRMKMLHRQAERRFGELPRWAVERLERASVDQLDRWAERLLDAKTLGDVFDDE